MDLSGRFLGHLGCAFKENYGTISFSISMAATRGEASLSHVLSVLTSLPSCATRARAPGPTDHSLKTQDKSFCHLMISGIVLVVVKG